MTCQDCEQTRMHARAIAKAADGHRENERRLEAENARLRAEAVRYRSHALVCSWHLRELAEKHGAAMLAKLAEDVREDLCIVVGAAPSEGEER